MSARTSTPCATLQLRVSQRSPTGEGRNPLQVGGWHLGVHLRRFVRQALLMLRWIHSLWPEHLGMEATVEIERTGNEARWWFLGPDGAPTDMGPGRLQR